MALTLGVVLVWNSGFYALFDGSIFWVLIEVLVAPAIVLVVVCCSDNGNDGGGF
jgi:hypothetical protein